MFSSAFVEVTPEIDTAEPVTFPVTFPVMSPLKAVDVSVPVYGL